MRYHLTLLPRSLGAVRPVSVALALGALLVPAGSAQAINWDGGGQTSEWLVNENWQGDRVPTTNDTAVIVGDTATITGATVPTVQSVTLGAGSLRGGLVLAGTVNPARLTSLGSVTVNPAANLTLGGGGPASSQVNAGSFNTAGVVNVGSRGALQVNGPFLQSAGTVTITGGALTAGSVLSQAGLLEATGAINANVKIGDGAGAQARLSPGASIGTLAINGNLTLDRDARLAMQFRSSPTGGAQFDALNVSGTLTLGGTLDLSILAGLPTPGAQFSIISAGAIDPDSRFDDIVGLPAGAGSWVPKFDLTGGMKVFYTILRGDMNGDFAVDDLDVERFAWALRDGATYHQHFVLAGNSAFATMADMDLDGDRTWADVPLFLDAVEMGGGSAPAALTAMAAILAAVPEPSSAALAAAAFVGAAATRRRNRGGPRP